MRTLAEKIFSPTDRPFDRSFADADAENSERRRDDDEDDDDDEDVR